MNTIDLIQSLISKQKNLTRSLHSQSSAIIDEITLRYHVPCFIKVGRQTWATKVHGIGILFKNTSTGEIIDMHVGVLENPDVFDAWRLFQYSESIKGKNHGYNVWCKVLEDLATEGMIIPDAKYYRHYTLSK